MTGLEPGTSCSPVAPFGRTFSLLVSTAAFLLVRTLASESRVPCAGQERLRLYAEGGRHESPVAGFWTEKEIARL